MQNYVIGNVREIFYQTDKGYMVGIIKVRETSDKALEHYVNRSLTFNGSFHELNINNDYKFYGEVNRHPKYGFQYKVSFYERLIPEEKNSIISFLSSGLFPGIGIKTAKKIVNKLGSNALDLILEDYHNLLKIPSIKEEKAIMIHDILYNEQMSYKTILYLEDLGFSMNDAVKIYEEYENETITIVENNIYNLIKDIVGISYLSVDKIALKLGFEKDDMRRVESCILFTMLEECYSTGNTYSLFEELYPKIIDNLKIDIDENKVRYYLEELNKNKKVVILDNKYVLREIYEIEKNISNKIIKLVNKPKKEIDNIEENISLLEQILDIKYNELQKESIISSLKNNFNIITGGPGTGKTTIIKGIVEIFKKDHLLNDDDLSEHMVLLAPTGRAARRIMETTNFKAQTIHKFLKWDKESNTFEINKYNKSDAKIVLIDEASMIDIFLFNSLLEALKDNVQIILVGDANQLPSVSPGQILKDLIDSEVVPVVKLNELYRQKEDSYIISLANEINTGIIDEDFTNRRGDYNFIETRKEQIEYIVCELCKKAIERNYNYNQIQVLVPMYRGMNGIDNLNNRLQQIFNPKDKYKNEYIHNGVVFREGDKVLQTKNLNDLEISNGDIGIIERIVITKNGVEAQIDFDGVIVDFNRKHFEDLKLGYAISIHKSQGSEFDLVIMPMDISFRRMLYRKLLYTGVTRTKKSLTLVGEKEAFLYAINNLDENRFTLLKDFLKNSINF